MNKFGEWGDFVEAVHRMPKHWLPAALLTIVEECINKKCFDGQSLKQAIDEKLNYMKDPSKKREQL